MCSNGVLPIYKIECQLTKAQVSKRDYLDILCYTAIVIVFSGNPSSLIVLAISATHLAKNEYQNSRGNMQSL